MSRAPDRLVHLSERVGVRITALLTCPNWRCGRILYSPRPRIGETWMSCNRGDGWSQRNSPCGQHWLNLTLPAASTGDDLARVIGEDEAIALLWRLETGEIIDMHEEEERPDRMFAAELLMHRLLVDDCGQPIHVQIPCRRRDEHLYRYAPIQSFLRAIKLAL